MGWEILIEELHAMTTKFRNMLPFHYRKTAIAQNYERETNFVQKAYFLTLFSH